MLASKYECTGCEKCKAICPQNAISFTEDKDGFEYPVIDYNLCVSCNACTRLCPILNYNIEDLHKPIGYYVAYSQNEELRKNGTSGGVVSAILDKCLSLGGVIYASAFDSGNLVFKRCTERLQLSEFQGSKYIQSKTLNIYNLR